MNANSMQFLTRLTVVCSSLVLSEGLLGQEPQQTESASHIKTLGESVKLEWKLAQGETLFYQLAQEKTFRNTVEGKPVVSRDRQYFLYRWDVVLVRSPDGQDDSRTAAIKVHFGRILHQISTPANSMLVDTYSPQDRRNQNAQEKEMQDAAFRTLRSQFLFYLGSSGASVLTNDITEYEFADELLAPATLESPYRFTTSELVEFPDAPVSIGDQWVTVRKSGGRPGITEFELVGQTERAGRKCWLIEGKTEVESLPTTLVTDDVRSFDLQSVKSRYCFDADLGRLVDCEELATFQVRFNDGHVEQVTLKTTRELVTQLDEPELIGIERELSNGTKRKFWYRDGLPINAEGDWASITRSGLSVILEPKEDGIATPDRIAWLAIVSIEEDRRIRSVTVEEVSGEKSVLTLNLENPEVKDGVLVLWLKETDISASLPSWFEDDEITELIFRIVVTDDQDQQLELLQPILATTGKLREQVKNYPNQQPE